MPVVPPGSILKFGEFELDCGNFELRRQGKLLRVERKPMELLILLASREGQLVTRPEIAERLWSKDVFVDIEHGINTAIRKLRYQLRDDPEEPRFIQTVTGRGYRFIAPIAPVLAVSPVSAVGAVGAAEPEAAIEARIPSRDAEKPDAATTAVLAKPSRRLWIVVGLCAAVLVAALVLTVGPHPLASRLIPRATSIRSLAVIPLDNLSGDPNQEYFADGMTDELTTMLAKDSTLRITSRTSAMQYKRARRPLQEIARELHVDGIVEGSVSRSGTHVHMTLQLIRADNDSHVWADSYDRTGNDSTLPDDAARAIAKHLHCSSSSSSPVKYVDPAAYDAYMRGKYLWFSDTHESGKYFQKAIDIQPDYALAWAWLSMYYGADIADGDRDPRTGLGVEKAAAKRALELDPNLAEAHQAMGAAYFFQDWNFAEADSEVLKAISLEPNYAELYHLRAKVLTVLNRNAEAIESEKKGMELNPFEKPWALASAYLNARQYDAAMQDAELRLKGNPTDPGLLLLKAGVYRGKGMYKESVETWARFHQAIGDAKGAAGLMGAYKEGGYRGFVRWELAGRTKQAKTEYVSPVELAGYRAELGEREATLSLLEGAFQQRSPDVLEIQVEPAFDFLRGDPRFRSLVQRIGLPLAH